MKWLAAVMALMLLGWALMVGKRLGGLSSSYTAADRDPWLTAQAESALPLIDSVRSYQTKYRQLPATETDLLAWIPPESVSPDGPMAGWRYFTDGTEWRLYRKLGWDPALIYEQDESSSRWVFDPGDGRPEKEIILKPAH